MNKFAILTLLVSFFVVGGLFAAEAKPVVKVSTGTVVSATDTVLIVKVGNKEETFVVDAKTVIAGKDKKAVVITALKAGEKVEVKYTVDAKKALTAVSVTLK